MKKFLISIDTEGDDLWSWKIGDQIKTENAKYLERFQKLCDKYSFKPTYLTDYEMASDDVFTQFALDALKGGRCEIGMHLHAWNSPPDYSLEVRGDASPGAPYLIEYPEKIMDEKIGFMTVLLAQRFGIKPVTHRAGRWAMDRRYFALLEKYGYEYDCSVTPGKDWSRAYGQSPESSGSDYSKCGLYPEIISGTGILEIPVTVREDHRLRKNAGEGIRKSLRNRFRAMKGQGKIWLRPDGRNIGDLIYLSDTVLKARSDDYLMFMLHSSELMPGGNPRFDTMDKIEALYRDIETLFEHISGSFEGMTIGQYGALKKETLHERI